jgi:hypothetical protein
MVGKNHSFVRKQGRQVIKNKISWQAKNSVQQIKATILMLDITESF